MPSQATLSMPDAPRHSPKPAGLLPARNFHAAGAPLVAVSPKEPAPHEAEAVSSPRALAAPIAAVEDKGSLLDEILRSGDDNDPRLDGAFNSLPLETRRRFQRKYRELPAESRNQRGTIVYLLGKNLVAPEDWDFLREVAGEPPCLSLSDCSHASPGDDGSEAPGTAVTLAYPALVALKQAERVLSEGGPVSARREALAVVRAGTTSLTPAVVDAATRLEGRY